MLCGAVYPPGGPGCAGAGWAQRQRLARVMQMPELLLPAGAELELLHKAECIVLVSAQCSVMVCCYLLVF